MKLLRYFPFLLSAGLIACVSCSSREAGDSAISDESIKPEMQDAYQTAKHLYRYVWSEERFFQKKSEAEIASLLDQISTDFHRVREKTPIKEFEPGFRVALGMNQDMLREVSQRFKAGQKDYARWRLMSLTSNCIACHSRFEVSSDFVGPGDPPRDDSVASQLAFAEFLFATRQFDHGGEQLFAIAERLAKESENADTAFRALKEWLVIEVRVKSRPLDAAKRLEKLSAEPGLTEDQKVAISRWIRDLKLLAKKPIVRVDPIVEAGKLIQPALQGQTHASDERHLVSTLRATSLLHKVLQGDGLKDEAKRRQATYLLALAYAHIPVMMFDVYREQYLEQTIREFPSSAEAKKAFLLYQALVEEGSSGSGGLHMDSETQGKLRELRLLAFGTPELVVPDTYSE